VFAMAVQPVTYDNPSSNTTFIRSTGSASASTDAMTVRFTGAGVLAGNTYSLSVILDKNNVGTGNIQETVATVTGTFAGSSPQDIAVATLNAPTVYTQTYGYSDQGTYPWGLQATVTTPNEGLSNTVAGATTPTTDTKLVFGPAVSDLKVNGSAAGSTISTGDTLTLDATAGPTTNSIGGCSWNTNFTIDGVPFSASSNISFSGASDASFTVGSITNGVTYTLQFKAVKTTGANQSIVLFEHVFTGA
jgi:hypothetical protein